MEGGPGRGRRRALRLRRGPGLLALEPVNKEEMKSEWSRDTVTRQRTNKERAQQHLFLIHAAELNGELQLVVLRQHDGSSGGVESLERLCFEHVPMALEKA
jgi:hypothetical protein